MNCNAMDCGMLLLIKSPDCNINIIKGWFTLLMVVVNAFVNGYVRSDCIDNDGVHNGECLLIQRVDNNHSQQLLSLVFMYGWQQARQNDQVLF